MVTYGRISDKGFSAGAAICLWRLNGEKMKRLFLVLVPLVLAGGFFGYRYLTRDQPVKVAAMTAEIGLVETTVANTRAGSVKARRRAELAPAIGGRIAALAVRKGDTVEAGQVLLSLWNKDLEAELTLAEMQSQVAEAGAHEACLMADYSRRQGQRQSELHRNRSTSESSYDEAMVTAAAKEAACRAAQAQRQAALARIAAARAMVERTIIIAPFAGIVAEVNGEIGEYITPSPPGIATLPVIDLINLDSLYVAAPIDEIDAAQIRAEMEVRVTLDAFPKRVFAGRTRAVSPYVLELAKQARTVEVEVDLDRVPSDVRLLVGYSADVEIIVARREGVLRISSEALHKDGYVYVVDSKTGRLSRRPVTVGLSNWQFTEVREGLSAGERVITTIDRQGVKDGALVEE